MLQLTSMARPSIAMALRLFLSFWSFTSLSFWIPPSPLRFSFSGLPVFRFVSLSVEKSGNCFVAFVAQMMDGPTHGRMERWFAAFGVKAVRLISFLWERYLRIVWIIARRCRVFAVVLALWSAFSHLVFLLFPLLFFYTSYES
jgi:hypothetical protein